MNWDKLKQGVFLEKSKMTINWDISINELIDKFRPYVVENSGYIELIWRGESLFNGVEGDWTISFLNQEVTKTFNSIYVIYLGDIKAFQVYDLIKSRLLNILGYPIFTNESIDEKEIKWAKNNCYVHLYLFEMHAYRCILRVGKNN